jgi:serine/threonine protein kinase
MTLNTNELLGYRLGEYQLERVLGSGGTGFVYLANRIDHQDEQVAIKILMSPTSDMREQGEFRRRFRREAKILTTLRHDHIVPVLGVGEDEPHQFAYLVLSYIGGGTLADRLEEGPLPLAQVLAYITQLADALDYVHDHHIIHRDLTPSNVLLDEHDQVYLADFGIAKLLEPDATTITSTNQVLGTPGYMAPEQITGQTTSAATDVYGLGILAYQMVTSQLPFAASSLVTTLLQIVSEPPASPRELRAELPQPAAEAILRAIAKAPEQRFASTSAFARALERGMQNKPMTPSPQTILGQMQASESELRQPDTAPVAWVAPNQRHRRPWWGVVAACGLLLAVLMGLAGIRVLSQFGQLHAMTGPSVSSQPTMLGTDTPTVSPTSTWTPVPTRVPKPTATPFPPKNALVSNITIVTMSYNAALTPTGCVFDKVVDPILTNRGAQLLNWSATYVPPSTGATTTVSFAPSSGTLAPNQSVTVILTGGVVPWGSSVFASYRWKDGQVTESMVCPPNPVPSPTALAPKDMHLLFAERHSLGSDLV